MSTTSQEIIIKKEDGYTLVLSVAGFVVVNEPHKFEFLYRDINNINQPHILVVGNINPSRVVDNNNTSNLWIKTIEYDIIVVPNIE